MIGPLEQTILTVAAVALAIFAGTVAHEVATKERQRRRDYEARRDRKSN